MTFGALGQVRADDRLRVARSLGYGPVQAWLKVVLPLVYPQIRLPVYAVLAYSLSVVDMAIVLGPTTPPTLAPMVLRWFHDPDLAHALPGRGRRRPADRPRGPGDRALARRRGGARPPGAALAGRRPPRRHRSSARGTAWAGLALLFGLSLGSLLSLAAWSVAGRWRFPDAWPEQLDVGLGAGPSSPAPCSVRPRPPWWSGSPPPASRSSWSPAASRTRPDRSAARARRADPGVPPPARRRRSGSCSASRCCWSGPGSTAAGSR